jgi:hypothetical protein
MLKTMGQNQLFRGIFAFLTIPGILAPAKLLHRIFTKARAGSINY